MSFTQFTAFAAVAKHLNVTTAANMLHVSQPSLSKHLKALEESFKLRLFTRHAKGITLTDDGYEFFKDIEPILTQLDRINHRYLNGSTRKINNLLKVGGTYGPTSRILPSLLAAFKNSHPNVDVTLRTNSGGIIHQKILHGDLEIAVCSRAPAATSMLYSESYVPMKLVAFAAKCHPAAKKKELTLSDLEDIPFIVRVDSDLQSTTHTALNALRKQGYKVNIAMRCESPEAVQSAVEQKLGIGFLYYDAVKAAIERGSFKIIQISGLEIEGQTYVIYHNERPLSPHAEEFLKLLRDWRDNQTAKKPKPLPSTRVGARTNVATCAFAASTLP
jgi:LysR family transcriptional regulator, transcriptional activator of the cysJI operon